MDALIIEDGKIVNIALVDDAAFATLQGWVIPAAGKAYGIGWTVGSGGKYTPPAADPLDMAAARAEALATAIAYGNRLTQGEISQWAGVEPFSWPLQRDEAAKVRAGASASDLGEGAVLPGLAEDKGISLQAYADDVWANAMRYQAVLKAAVYLRRTATNTLTDEAIDTPAKLAEAVAALTLEADVLAAQLLGG